MNQPRNIITTIKRRARRTALAAAAGILVFAASAYAHGGFDHVMGTVVKVTDNVVTVKTAKGNVDVKVDDKTEITKDNVKAGRAELKPDVRVVFDIPETSKDKVAASVKIGTGAMAAGGHDEHHETAGH